MNASPANITCAFPPFTPSHGTSTGNAKNKHRPVHVRKLLPICTLEVETDRLRLRSATYKLNLYLPHKVDADEGKAEWDAKSETLKVSCPILDEEYRLGT